MSATKTTLAIIPARGQSKGIPRKNLRLFNGKPLIAHMIEKGRRSEQIDWVVVSSDDAEILETARRYGADTLLRPAELATDVMTLDPAVHHAVVELERRGTCTPSLVATLQPTSPLMSIRSIDRVIEQLKRRDDIDTVIAAVDDTHLAWRETAKGLEPMYTERVCRQWLQKQYRETGGILCSRREFITPTSRIGKRLHLEMIPMSEAIDIDNSEDWAAAEAISLRRRIAFVFAELPLGHSEPGMQLVNALPGHELTFLCVERPTTNAYDLLTTAHYAVEWVAADDWVSGVGARRFDAVVLVHLTTPAEAAKSLSAQGVLIIALHDRGEGAVVADVSADPQTSSETDKLIEHVKNALNGLRGGR